MPSPISRPELAIVGDGWDRPPDPALAKQLRAAKKKRRAAINRARTILGVYGGGDIAVFSRLGRLARIIAKITVATKTIRAIERA